MTWLEEFVALAHDCLGVRVIEALWARGVSSEQIEMYQLGYMSGQLPKLEYPKAFLEWCRGGRRLEDSFVLPLTNALGQIRGLQFRRVDPDKKGYSDYTPFPEEPSTFGFVQAMPHIWRTEAVVIVEGVFDVFPVQRCIPQVIPMLTNRLSEAMGRALKRLVTDIWLAFDMDPKGREAVLRTSWTYRDRFTIHDIKFPSPMALDGRRRVKDPSELWEVWGDDRFKKVLQDLVGD